VIFRTAGSASKEKAIVAVSSTRQASQQPTTARVRASSLPVLVWSLLEPRDRLPPAPESGTVLPVRRAARNRFDGVFKFRVP
jgi:hypothetical protein